ncbi:MULTISPECIES: GerAB/ArcD/ProY family transporter [Bacillaceae]|uniref:Spore gernimation protein KB n=1 Tax=Domibacillus aminovorans TaxID=29332 RepID=A0A177KXA3_9BACI|nr:MULTISPECIES: GerAB/ArcD/ProY family transporter [Bacillaceae]OAH57982.1 spore gernimation protein KB [Domibacillus aminovorans]
MEKAKISAYQLFTLIILFEIGTAAVFPVGAGAEQSSWLAILIAMAGGFCLFFIHYGLYRYYPDLSPTEYMQILLGSILGKILAFCYVLYFVYIAANILRAFGVMLVTIAYPATPVFIINALFILVIIYTVYKGIEVISRTSEVLFVGMCLLLLSGFLLMIISGNIHLENLKPVLEKGLSPVIKTVFRDTLYFPFGQIVAFAMILPYVKEREKVKRTGLWAMGMSGLLLALFAAGDISVLGVDHTSRSQFPLLASIQSIEVAGFLERLDIYFILFVMIGGFLKLSIFFYVAVMGASHLFQVKHPSHLAYPMGIVVLLGSMAVVSSYTEYIQEWRTVVSPYIEPSIQVILPILLLIIAFFKNRKKAG